MTAKGTQSGVASDVENFPEMYDASALAVGTDMAGHDAFLLGPKVVLLDAFIVDLLDVDTSAQTFKLKMILNLDWDDDGTIEPERKLKRNLLKKSDSIESHPSNEAQHYYKTGKFHDTIIHLLLLLLLCFLLTNNNTKIVYEGKYVPREEFIDDPESTTWNPEVVLVNAIADGDPIEAGSKMHCVQMIQGRPVISRKVLYQPECRCEFTYANFPFDETDLVIKFSSNKWSAEQLTFAWSERLMNADMRSSMKKTESMFLKQGVDAGAIGGLGQSEFEIVSVRVETVEKDLNSMQRYDNTEGAFSEARLIVRVRRDPYSYLIRVAFVTELLMILEVLSFITDREALPDRFSISGTIFLAMVSLYGPMADALPKVSVVTRVDKWHLINFVLLFASNVENFVFFMLNGWLNESFLYYSEVLLACLYLYLVIKTFLWFIEPLSKRDEWEILVDTIEDSLGLMCGLFGFAKSEGSKDGKFENKRKSLMKTKDAITRMMGKSETQAEIKID